jgi:hypothetical protein
LSAYFLILKNKPAGQFSGVNLFIVLHVTAVVEICLLTPSKDASASLPSLPHLGYASHFRSKREKFERKLFGLETKKIIIAKPVRCSFSFSF